jgi:hypothetical protein
MAPARYEVRVNGALSERARGAFSALDVRSVPPQTIVVRRTGGAVRPPRSLNALQHDGAGGCVPPAVDR